MSTDAARRALDEATDVRAQAATLTGTRAARRAAAKEIVKANRERLKVISNEVAGAERWTSLGTVFDTVNIVSAGASEGRVGVEKAIANKALGDAATWAGAEVFATAGFCVAGPVGAAAGGLAGGLAGSLCYGKVVQPVVEGNIDRKWARARAAEKRREAEEQWRQEIGRDLDRWLADRQREQEREAMRRRRAESESRQRQQAEWEAFIAAQRPAARRDSPGSTGGAAWAPPSASEDVAPAQGTPSTVMSGTDEALNRAKEDAVREARSEASRRQAEEEADQARRRAAGAMLPGLLDWQRSVTGGSGGGPSGTTGGASRSGAAPQAAVAGNVGTCGVHTLSGPGDQHYVLRHPGQGGVTNYYVVSGNAAALAGYLRQLPGSSQVGPAYRSSSAALAAARQLCR
jgi:hypothetical protein